MTSPGRPPAVVPRVHVPCLLVALAIMVAVTVYPPLLSNRAGKADHVLALLVFWAMSAGFVRGVGFRPASRPWRWLFSGPACTAALAMAAVIRLLAWQF
jgi:predicted membrane protein